MPDPPPGCTPSWWTPSGTRGGRWMRWPARFGSAGGRCSGCHPGRRRCWPARSPAWWPARYRRAPLPPGPVLPGRHHRGLAAGGVVDGVLRRPTPARSSAWSTAGTPPPCAGQPEEVAQSSRFISASWRTQHNAFQPVDFALTPDSPFPALVDYRLADLDLENRIAPPPGITTIRLMLIFEPLPYVADREPQVLAELEGSRRPSRTAASRRSSARERRGTQRAPRPRSGFQPQLRRTHAE
jgi:hypothetical protein